METEKEQKYQRAKQHVEELKKFYNHLFSYIVVIGFLAAVNYYNNQWEYAWFLWPAFGWGIGLAFHAAKAYEINPMFDKNWEDRKIKEYMEKEEYKEQKKEEQRWE